MRTRRALTPAFQARLRAARDQAGLTPTPLLAHGLRKRAEHSREP
jgi:hypothetical protein